MKRRIVSLAIALLTSVVAFAGTLRVPTFIGDNMVLQREAVANLWGWADAGATVKIETSWLGKAVSVKADESGCWLAEVKTPKASQNEWVKITCGKEQLEFLDVKIGEVWVCSGQSNMQWYVSKSIDVKKYLEFPNENINIYNTGRISATEPQDDIENSAWATSNPLDLQEFSAVAYAFGDELQRALKVPVGLVCVAYGGTSIESWTPAEVIDNNPLFTLGLKGNQRIDKKTKDVMVRDLPGAQYNAGIHPIEKATIAGVIWYQGCQNVKYSSTYYDQQQEAMINAWREKFRNPELPFYLVQLVPHTYQGIDGALLRECQARVAAKMNHVEMVGTIDQQDRLGDIHPRNKKVVGERLAACALGDHYGKKVDYKAPAYERVEYKDGAAYVYFKETGRKLVCYDDEIVGFQLSDGGEFYLAKAEIVENNCVKVWVDGMTSPSRVRYCFNESVGNLQSSNGLPVTAFRTDKDNKELGARPWLPPFDNVEVTIKGGKFERGVFQPDAKLWSNRTFKLDDAIEGLYGFEYLMPQWLKKEAVIPCKVVYTAHADGRIYMMCRSWSWATKQKGWKLLPNSKMVYTDPKRPNLSGVMWVAYREVKKGNKVTIKWESDANSGFLPIATKINY